MSSDPAPVSPGLLRSSPVRLSVFLALLFAAISFVSLGATYLVVRDAQRAEIRASLQQDMAGLRAAPSATALFALVRAQALETDPERRLISYLLPSGRIAGNAAIVQEAEGFRAIALGDASVAIEGEYISLTEVVNSGLLTVALSAEPLDRLRSTFLRVFVFSLLPTCLIALGSGLFLARRAARDLAGIEQTLKRLTAGDPTARVVVSDRPMDDLTRIANSVNRMARAQEKSISALTQISTDIAHDLKSPIQRVGVLLAQLRETPALPDAAADLADQARDETQGIVDTFESLLQIAQVEGGSEGLALDPVNLCPLAATFAEIYAPAAEDQGRHLDLVTPPGPVWIQGNGALLGQLLANLIENALRHTPVGTDISIAVTQDTPGATLSVRDRGPGIPAAEQGNVLRRLYRLETSRTTPGNGLGLSLVAAIADLHDARLDLVEAGPGLRVDVTFDRLAGARPPGDARATGDR